MSAIAGFFNNIVCQLFGRPFFVSIFCQETVWDQYVFCKLVYRKISWWLKGDNGI